MFIGIDHGTTAMRFAGESGEFKISREAALEFTIEDLSRICPVDGIEGIALCYSMGDNISSITHISKVKNRGLISREGAGQHIGGGTRVFDEVAKSGIPAVVIPGLHRRSPTDPRFKVYSHQSSPEKIGIAYEVSCALGDDVIVSDVSSNTVTLLISALDVDAIRRIDAGECTANEAFQHAGVNFSLPEKERMRSVAMFAAMECAALLLLNNRATVALAGSLAPVIAPEVKALLGRDVAVFDEWCASRGLVRIAHDVFCGKKEILGLDIDL